MNVVYLHAHDAGRYVQPYGFPFENPNLMKFAKEGVLFRKAFCIAPTCGPSRAALTSGQTPHEVGMYGLPGGHGWLFDDYRKHLSHAFRRAGYATILAGVQHECDHADLSPLDYERILETEPPAREQAGECYPETIDKIEAFLATRKSGEDDRPFFLSIGIDEPHRDNLKRPELNLHGKSDRFTKTRYYDPDKLDYRYTAPPPWLPDIPEMRKEMESYREGVKIMDEYMGRIFYALHQSGFDDDTLVVVTSDHGIEFSGGKKTLSDQGIQVMLMIRGPEGSGFTGGGVVEPMVTHLDLYPTLVDLCGLKPDHLLRGKSLLPLVREEVTALHDYVFTEQTYHGPREAMRSARSERYKYIRRESPVANQLHHDGPGCKVMEAFGWYHRETGTEEFYDLHLDPWEACNRIADPALAREITKHAAALDAWMENTGDPFPSGDFPEPPGRRPYEGPAI